MQLDSAAGGLCLVGGGGAERPDALDVRHGDGLVRDARHEQRPLGNLHLAARRRVQPEDGARKLPARVLVVQRERHVRAAGLGAERRPGRAPDLLELRLDCPHDRLGLLDLRLLRLELLALLLRAQRDRLLRELLAERRQRVLPHVAVLVLVVGRHLWHQRAVEQLAVLVLQLVLALFEHVNVEVLIPLPRHGHQGRKLAREDALPAHLCQARAVAEDLLAILGACVGRSRHRHHQQTRERLQLAHANKAQLFEVLPGAHVLGAVARVHWDDKRPVQLVAIVRGGLFELFQGRVIVGVARQARLEVGQEAVADEVRDVVDILCLLNRHGLRRAHGKVRGPLLIRLGRAPPGARRERRVRLRVVLQLGHRGDNVLEGHGLL